MTKECHQTAFYKVWGFKENPITGRNIDAFKERKVIVEPTSCYWDNLLAKQICPKHRVPVAECPVDLTDAKFDGPFLGSAGIQDKKIPVDKPYIGPSPLLPDKPSEGGTFDVNHYSVYCQTCKHPSLWHWTSEENQAESTAAKGTYGISFSDEQLKEGCRGFGCQCHRNIPGEPVPTMCDVCMHPIRWHDKKGPRCTAIDCPCGRTAA